MVNVDNSTPSEEHQQNVTFYTGSLYSGNWNKNYGMHGEYGEYLFPNGIYNILFSFIKFIFLLFMGNQIIEFNYTIIIAPLYCNALIDKYDF